MAPAVRANDFEGVLDELERQAADPLAAERQVDDGVRPAADVDDGRGEGLVHRHGAVAEPGDPGTIAERLGEGGTEHERDVLDRVVLVDLEVAVGVDGEVEQAVVGERAEEVVVEADPGVDPGVARAIEAERDRDLGLGGRPGDRHAAALARADLDGTERGRHAAVSLASVGGGGDEPVVLGGVSDRQAEVVGERMARPERAGHEAAGEEAFGDRRRPAPASRSRPG